MGAYTIRWALAARLLNLGLDAMPMAWPHPSMRLLFALQIFDAFSLQLELPSGSVNQRNFQTIRLVLESSHFLSTSPWCLLSE